MPRPIAVVLLPGLVLAAETHRVEPKAWYHTFSASHPVAHRIRPGDTVITRTLDAGGNDERSQNRTTPPNPLTGPFYIEGAEPGDVVTVHFRRIALNRNWGWTNYRLLLNALTNDSVEGVYSDQYKADLVRKGRANMVPWDIDIARGIVRLREPSSAHLKFEFPAKTMLGCVGVAAPGDSAPPSSISGPYGGNIDYNAIGEGATLILPVFHPGALFFLGDAHALQADGEPLGTGIETSAEVEFTVGLQKNARVSMPRVETADSIISVGSQPEFASSLDRGLQLATTDMWRWLTDEYKLEPWAAHQLIGLHGRYHVVTVAGSMALEIPKKWLPPRP